MMPVAALCTLCAASYVETPRWKDPGSDIRAIAGAIDGALVIAIPGTKQPEDFLRDADCLPRRDVDLGWCPDGFLREALILLDLVRDAAAAVPVVITGHSLGGASAILLAGKLVALGLMPRAVVTFGAPHTGFGRLRRQLAGVPLLQLYRHGNDPIPELPPAYEHPAELIAVGAPALDPLACHFLAGYAAALPPG